MFFLVFLSFSRSTSTRAMPVCSPPQSPITAPQGSTASACPYDERFSWCLPTWADARTKHCVSMARARSNICGRKDMCDSFRDVEIGWW